MFNCESADSVRQCLYNNNFSKSTFEGVFFWICKSTCIFWVYKPIQTCVFLQIWSAVKFKMYNSDFYILTFIIRFGKFWLLQPSDASPWTTEGLLTWEILTFTTLCCLSQNNKGQLGRFCLLQPSAAPPWNNRGRLGRYWVNKNLLLPLPETTEVWWGDVKSIVLCCLSPDKQSNK